jgi:hypothetical protein
VPAAERAAPVGAWTDPFGRAGRGRRAPAEGGLRAVHQRVLRSFATDGRPPTAAELSGAAAPYGKTADVVLAELHAGDFLRLDATGQVRTAYPFSAGPTSHVVQIDDGPRVYAMCAIDALGIAAMLATGVTITSADPRTGEPTAVTVAADGRKAAWEPATTVVFAGQQAPGEACSGPGTGPVPAAADVCCRYISFFTSRASATDWARAHPEVTGHVLKQARALKLGTRIFGPVLADAG